MSKCAAWAKHKIWNLCAGIKSKIWISNVDNCFPIHAKYWCAIKTEMGIRHSAEQSSTPKLRFERSISQRQNFQATRPVDKSTAARTSNEKQYLIHNLSWASLVRHSSAEWPKNEKELVSTSQNWSAKFQGPKTSTCTSTQKLYFLSPVIVRNGLGS